ncbi:MAG TPA: ABC transporter permease subunit [Thermoplasmata archaeon]|jgi:phosphate transport system permease protein|nr:ABC transporter permease subunit [Thermoplasmata archaeon]
MVLANASEARRSPEDILYQESLRTKWRLGFDRVIGWLLPLLFIVAILPIADLVYYVGSRALPTLTFQVLTSTSLTQTDALGVPIVSTAEIMVFATLLAVAFGIFGGVATAEYLSERMAGWVRMTANLLVGLPSVTLGYFGYFTFVLYFGWGLSYIAAVVTLAFFMTPYIFRTADLAFTSVPRPIREAAFGSGATGPQYIVRVATPIAFPQVLNGIFLAMAIGVGETAPIVLTTTLSTILPTSIYSPVSFLTALIWENFAQPKGSPLIDLAFQAAFLLIITVIALNIVVRLISYNFQKRIQGLYQ